MNRDRLLEGHDEAVLINNLDPVAGVTEWMDGWKRRDWNLSSGGPVKNKDDFIELDETMKGMPVKWVSIGVEWVRR